MTQAPDSVTFDPSRQTPQVTAAKNVAMVTIPTEGEEQKLSPELGKQVQSWNYLIFYDADLVLMKVIGS